MATSAAKTGSQPALKSDWGGLSPHLIAEFYAVKQADADGVRYERDESQPAVYAPITDGNIETTVNWQSAFENIGPDQKLGTLSAMLQAGGFTPLLRALKERFSSFGDVIGSVESFAKEMEGRSSFTKLNSTQVFNGMPPLKINVTAHFRAWKDARSEVQAPMNKLMEWALPRQIANDGALVALAKSGNPNPWQSFRPTVIAMKYAGMLFSPIVIESIPYPLTGPRDGAGNLSHASLTLSLASLTALDSADWGNAMAGKQVVPR